MFIGFGELAANQALQVQNIETSLRKIKALRRIRTSIITMNDLVRVNNSDVHRSKWAAQPNDLKNKSAFQPMWFGLGTCLCFQICEPQTQLIQKIVKLFIFL